MIKEATIQFPEELPGSLKLTDAEFLDEMRFLAAAKLYELGRLTGGQAARLAGLDRLVFMARLGTVGVAAINLRGEEIDAEIQAAQDLGGGG